MTIKEIAKLAGVSASTVSKIVNGKDQNINIKTRERVLKIVKDYNYTPYGRFHSLSEAKHFILGVLVRNVTVSASLVRGILKTAQQNGYTLLLCESGDSADSESKSLENFCKNNVDGILWEPSSPETCRSISPELSKYHIPYCLMNDFPSFPIYQIDFTQMGYQITKQLIERKHSSMICLQRKNDRRSRLVLEGFQKCLYDNHISYNDKMALYIDERTSISRMIQSGVTGIISPYYKDASCFYEQLTRQHYSIPEDCSLITLKDENDPGFPSIQISHLSVPWEEFGSYVCQQMIEICEKTLGKDSNRLYKNRNETLIGSTIGHPPFFKGKKIIVVGSINMDITFHVTNLPQSGKTIDILNSNTSAGGKAANQAVGITLLGHEAVLIGSIGNDADGDFILDALDSSGVITQGIKRRKDTPTGKAYIYILSDSESAISILPGANNRVTSESILNQRHFFQDAGFCLVSTEIPISAVETALQTAKENKVTTVLKPAVMDHISDRLLSMTDILIPNQKEAAALCPEYKTVEQQAEFFYQKGVPVTIITLGKQGCYLKTVQKALYFPAANFTATDTTGGADAFIACLVSYLSESYSLEDSIKIAMYAAGFCVSRQGVVPALTDRNTLEAYIAKQEESNYSSTGQPV